MVGEVSGKSVGDPPGATPPLAPKPPMLATPVSWAPFGGDDVEPNAAAMAEALPPLGCVSMCSIFKSLKGS